jgi:hypothetical protein
MKPLYKGGVIQNGEFNNGLMGWSTYRNIKAGVAKSPSGNRFAVVHGASSSLSGNGDAAASQSHSVYQKIQMQGDTHYSLSAWLQVSAGAAHVRAVVKTPNGENITAGAVDAQSGCWTMLKGGMTAQAYHSGQGEVFFEVVYAVILQVNYYSDQMRMQLHYVTDYIPFQSDGPVDIWVDSVSLQPFSFEEWDSHTRQSANKARRSTVKFIARGVDGAPMANANVSIELLRAGFPFGNTMTKEILSLPAYEKWFFSRFTVATMENEMKWYSTEWNPNQEDYRIPDDMLKLAQKYGVKVYILV